MLIIANSLAHLVALMLSFQPAPAATRPATAATDVVHLDCWVSSVTPTIAGRGDNVEICVIKLNEYLEWVHRRHTGQADYIEGQLVLFLNGLPLRGLHPESWRIEDNATIVGREGTVESTYLTFHLARTADSRTEWNYLLNRPAFSRQVSISVGFPDEQPVFTLFDLTSHEQVFQLIVVRKFPLIAGGLVMLTAIVIFWRFARNTDLIRDKEANPRLDGRRPFSLGRTQMAIWFFMAISAYFYLWMLTGDKDTIPASILGLLGISAGTALGATFIDAGKPTAASPQPTPVIPPKDRPKYLETLKTRLQELDNGITHAPAPPLELALLASERQRIEQHIRFFERPGFTQFLYDLLSDDDSVSFHRFQIFVWTLVLVIIFIKEVISDLAMPNFSTNLLALMGISAGTYLGFKIPQKV